MSGVTFHTSSGLSAGCGLVAWGDGAGAAPLWAVAACGAAGSPPEGAPVAFAGSACLSEAISLSRRLIRWSTSPCGAGQSAQPEGAISPTQSTSDADLDP